MAYYRKSSVLHFPIYKLAFKVSHDYGIPLLFMKLGCDELPQAA